MQINISNRNYNILRKLKKEHFIKIILFIITALVIVFTLLLTIFAITPMSNGVLKPVLKPLYAFIEDINGLESFQGTKGTWTLVQEINPVDINWIYVFNGNNSNIISTLALLGGSGWIAFLILFSYLKNMATPQSIQRKVRQGITFGYLKQSMADDVCDEIDYVIGEKIRPKEETDEEDMKEN